MKLFLFLLLTGVSLIKGSAKIRQNEKKLVQSLENAQNYHQNYLMELPQKERCLKLVADQQGKTYYHMKHSMNYVDVLQVCEQFLLPQESSNLKQTDKKLNKLLKITGNFNIFPNKGSVQVLRDMDFYAPKNEITWEDPKHLIPNGFKSNFEHCLRLNKDERPNCLYDEVSKWNPTILEAYQFFIKVLVMVLEEVDVERQQRCAKIILRRAIQFKAPEDVSKIIAKRKIHLDESIWANITALKYATLEGNVAIIKILVKANAKIDVQDNYGDTALLNAVEEGNLEIVEVLLEAKAKVDIQNKDGYTALMIAAGRGNLEIVKALLEAKAKIDIQNRFGETALMTAVWYNNLEIVKILLEAKTKIDVQDNDGETALLIAAKKENLEIVKVLLKAKVNIDVQDKDGETALMIAATKENLEIVKALLKAKANIDVQDKDGETALMTAVHRENIEIVKVLLKEGAKKATTNKFNQTAAQIAELKGFKNVADAIHQFPN